MDSFASSPRAFRLVDVPRCSILTIFKQELVAAPRLEVEASGWLSVLLMVWSLCAVGCSSKRCMRAIVSPCIRADHPGH